MHDLARTVDTNVRLHAEMPLLALACRVHLWIALTRFILGRTRRFDDRRIHDRPEIDPGKRPHREAVVQRLLDGWIAQRKPLLQK